jgi:hypothetical protein
VLNPDTRPASTKNWDNHEMDTVPSPAGYSGKPLADKLGLKPELNVYVGQPPAGLEELLDHAPYSTRLPKHADVILTFHDARRTLERRLPILLDHLVGNGMIWVCWPKKASGVPTDVTEDVVREVALPRGLVDVKVAAVDATWSGLKLVRRLENR